MWFQFQHANYDRPHYNVNMTSIEVGLVPLSLPSEIFLLGNKTGAIIDSGTTLAYLPDAIYHPLVKKVVTPFSYVCLIYTIWEYIYYIYVSYFLSIDCSSDTILATWNKTGNSSWWVYMLWLLWQVCWLIHWWKASTMSFSFMEGVFLILHAIIFILFSREASLISMLKILSKRITVSLHQTDSTDTETNVKQVFVIK